ncbi:hypothetical protein BC831DRAFT_466148 [Entophlyctis helioformis]|nr:hypothetical protein BC831DRAFT_466148 [Entophlyctis helioformis]
MSSERRLGLLHLGLGQRFSMAVQCHVAGRGHRRMSWAGGGALNHLMVQVTKQLLVLGLLVLLLVAAGVLVVFEAQERRGRGQVLVSGGAAGRRRGSLCTGVVAGPREDLCRAVMQVIHLVHAMHLVCRQRGRCSVIGQCRRKRGDRSAGDEWLIQAVCRQESRLR